MLHPPGRFFFIVKNPKGAHFGIFKSSTHLQSDKFSVLKSVDKRKPDRQNIRLILVCCQSPEELLCCQNLERLLIFSGHQSHIRPFSLSVRPSAACTWLPPKPSGSSSKAAERWLIMTGGRWLPLCFIPFTSHRLCNAFLGIIILIECRWCRVLFFSPCRAQGGRKCSWRSGDHRRYGANNYDKTHPLALT